MGRMKSFAFKKLDAFTAGSSGGNPAGAVYLNAPDEITADEMQKIARELKGFVSETGFVSPAGGDAYRLKYYSSEKEVDFCGHATIAIMYDLVQNNPEQAGRDHIRIITNKGDLTVENRIQSDDAVFITAPEPVFRSLPLDRQSLAIALGTEADAFNDEYPLCVVNAGLETLLVPFRRLRAVLSLAPDTETLKTYCTGNGVDIITVFTPETAGSMNSYRTRVFAPVFGYLEDPATGTGNAALGCCLLENKKWNGGPVSLEQGPDPDHPNIIRLITRTDAEKNRRVLFGGRAVVRIQGQYILP